MRKKISIIIPTYNGEKHIEKCLESVLNQTYNNLEIIIINDGSTDNTDNIIKKYLYDNRIVYIKRKNKGVSAARNVGLKYATGEYVYFMDSDDWIEKNTFEIIMKKNAKINSDVIHFNYYEEFKEKSIKNIDYSYIKNENIIEFLLNGKLVGYLWLFVFKTSIIKNIKFDENISFTEDKLYLSNVFINDVNVLFIDDYLYHYYINLSGATRNFKKIEKNYNDYLKVNEKIIMKLIERDKERNLKLEKIVQVMNAKFFISSLFLFKLNKCKFYDFYKKNKNKHQLDEIEIIKNNLFSINEKLSLLFLNRNLYILINLYMSLRCFFFNFKSIIFNKKEW